MFEMLASNKAHGSNYLRYQRAALIKTFSTTSKTLDQLKEGLKGYDLDIDVSAIEDHIVGLQSIGIEIAIDGNKYKLMDKIESLVLPERTACVKDSVNDIIDRVRGKLKYLDHKYLALIDLAYSDVASKAKKNVEE